jgi:hypothetical protein
LPSGCWQLGSSCAQQDLIRSLLSLSIP